MSAPQAPSPLVPGPAARAPTVSDRAVDLAGRAVIAALRRVPYVWRVPAMGWIARRVIGPLAGARTRVGANLRLVWPELGAADHTRLTAQVMDNFGRALIEVFSAPDFVARAAAAPVEGDPEGLAALRAADAEGRPVVLVTAHLGNYDAARAWLLAQGFRVGGFYRPLSNPLFNPRYVAAISAIGRPLFPAGREGMAGMVRFLRGGGMLGLVADHHIASGTALPFLGHPALTALSAAQLALRYKAALVPIYGIRQADGLSFRIRIEAPIPHTDPQTMTEALNASAGAMIEAHPGQWFWLHRRWKGMGG
jgi:Kdo2-lipid IVA lauroyltransferase/acyltransferase